MDRRRFLQAGTSVGVGAALAAHPLSAWAQRLGSPPRSVATRADYLPVAAFPSGVLSGDPTTDGVVLWTRIDPVAAGPGVTIGWEIGTDPSFGPGTILAAGTETTAAASDHTVHVEVAGLPSGATLWYRFAAGATTSPVARTKTLPAGSVDRVRIAYFSCQRYVHGYYSSHADLAARALDPATDVDLVVSLGDYVYEAGPADDVTVAGRVDPEAPTTTLEDFRRQYHLYRTDLDLQAMHAAFPVVGIFDNHDGLRDPADPAGPGAIAAFFEQMPLRRVAGDPNRQYRSFVLGDLAEVFLLDERQHRDPEPPSSGELLGTSSVDEPEMVEAGRTMLGAPQKAWLTNGLDTSGAAWKILGSQLGFWPFRSQRDLVTQATAGDGPQRNAGTYLNLIQWDGYQAERRELVDHIADGAIDDVVVISGDSHFWSAAELGTDWDDPATPYVLTEFAGSSVTSANGDEMGFPPNEVVRPLLAAANPLHLRYVETTTNGYGLLELTADRLTVTYLSPSSITKPDQPTRVLARFEVDRGSARIRQTEGEGNMPRPDDLITPDPDDPSDPTTPDDPSDPTTPGDPSAPSDPGDPRGPGSRGDPGGLGDGNVAGDLGGPGGGGASAAPAQPISSDARFTG
jgi:phosphodiesterase/alkaline phosphatase D-like protein